MAQDQLPRRENTHRARATRAFYPAAAVQDPFVTATFLPASSGSLPSLPEEGPRGPARAGLAHADAAVQDCHEFADEVVQLMRQDCNLSLTLRGWDRRCMAHVRRVRCGCRDVLASPIVWHGGISEIGISEVAKSPKPRRQSGGQTSRESQAAAVLLQSFLSLVALL